MINVAKILGNEGWPDQKRGIVLRTEGLDSSRSSGCVSYQLAEVLARCEAVRLVCTSLIRVLILIS